MYSHVFVRLKARFGLRPGDLIAMRRSVDAAAKTKLKGYISEVLNFDAPGTTFAWKLAHPIAKAEDLPAAIREVLESSPKVLNYSPAVITRKSSTPALVAPATYSMPDSSLELPSFDDAPAPESAEVPAFDEILTGFHDLISLLPDDYQIYGLKLQPFRAGCMPPRELATAVRDSVAKDMEAKGKWLDRSFTAKRMNEENQAKLVAEATAAGAGPDAIKTAQTTKLPNRTFHLDMSRTVGFWSADLLPGGGSIVDDTKFANSARGRAQAEADTRAAAGQADARARFVDRVLLVKIGEVFLKKGNRSKFVTQLQYNLQHKIGSRGVVKREHHNFLIVPPAPAAGSKQAYFSDEDLSVLTDAVRCVPGIDIVNAVIRTGTDMASMITAIQYLTAIASASQESDITAHTPAAAPSIVKSPSDARAAAAALFAPAAERLAAGTTADELLLRSRARASMLSVTRLGFKLDVHLHEPCPYKSKTTLNKELTMAARRETQLMLGLTTQIPHPGRAYYEEKDIEDAAEARKREDLVAEFEAERAKWLATDEGSAAAKAEAEAERKTAVSSMTDADAMKDEAEDEEDGEHKSSWIAPRSGVSVRVDVTESSALIGFYAGPDYVDAIGGQPTATGAETQTVVVLLSGGMDSPVAAFSMMRRGMRVILVHFQNANLADEDTVKHKIVQLAEQLSRYQVTTYLHIVPFSAIQDAIIMEVPSPARMLVYRRFMFHVASLVATKYNARFLVLGDALGQVASQTASNLFASYINAPLPILSPLVGTNKREIMAVAQQIGTYDISALPYGDCCSYFLAKHPLTRIRPEVLASYESAVGSKSPGGAVQLVKSAHLAAAILRWNKPDEPMETVKEAQPVASVYHEEVSKLLAACPMRPKDDGEADGTGDGEGEGAAAIVAEASYPLVEPSPAAGSPANADAEVSAEPRVKRSRAALDVASDSIMGATKTSGYNPNALSRLSAGVSAETVAAAQAAAEAAEAAGENAPLTAVASLSAAVALPAPRGAVARAYLDNAATTPLHPVVLSAMLPYLGGAAFGNPSSAHNAGLGAKAIVEEARRVVLGLINAPLAVAGQTSAEAVAAADAAASTTSGKPGRKMKDQLLAFTSGGTEANSLALIGSARAAVERHSASVRDAAMHIAATRASQGNGTGSASVYTHVRVHYITSPLEHSAILEAIRSIERSPLTLAVGTGLTTSAGGSLTVDVNVKVSVAVTYLRNNKSGVVDVDHLKYALSQDISRASTAAAAAASSDTVNVAPESNVVFSEACFPPEPTPVMTVVSLMHANNEVGTIQPLARIGAAVAAHRTSAASVPPVVFHTDACQSFAKVHLDVQECQLDLVSLNGHKVHGPKGVGALYIRPGITVAPLIVGGGHEGGIRPGTINVPGVVGFAAGAAHFLGAETCLINPALSPLPLTAPVVRAADAPARMTSALVSARPGAPLPSLKGAMMRIIKEIRDVFPRAQVNGGLGTLVSLGNISDVPTEPRDEAEPALPHVLSVLLDRSGWMDSGAIIKFLSARGVAVSMGSACATNSEPAPSHVLLGLDMRPEQANATVRISIGSLTTEAEVDALVSAIRELAQAKEGQFKVQGGR